MTEELDMQKNNNRINFLDNLRTFMIFLVVVLHSGLVYENNGFSAYIWIVFDPATNTFASELRTILDIFIMSTIFFVSGYLTPLSIKSKNEWRFIQNKVKRLIIPWAIAVCTLMPMYKLIFLASRNLPQQDWTTYFHWSNQVWSQNWLWFLPVLFLFNILYLGLAKLKIKFRMSLKQGIAAVFTIGFLFSVIMDLFNLEGWTKTILIDFQNERLLVYFMIFLLGSLCYKTRTFERQPKADKLYIILLCTIWIPISVYREFLLNSFFKPGEFILTPILDTFILWLSFHLSLLILVYLLVYTFRLYLNKAGKLSGHLGSNSYYVYIIHTIVMGILAWGLLQITLPSIVKFVLLTFLTFGFSNLLVSLFRGVTQLRHPTGQKSLSQYS